MTALANPALAGQVARLRTALLDCVTPEDIVTIVRAMITKAAEGSLGAARLVFSYVLGKPVAHETAEGAREAVKPAAVAPKPLTPEQEKSMEAMYQALYGETLPGVRKPTPNDAPPSALGRAVTPKP